MTTSIGHTAVLNLRLQSVQHRGPRLRGELSSQGQCLEVSTTSTREPHEPGPPPVGRTFAARHE